MTEEGRGRTFHPLSTPGSRTLSPALRSPRPNRISHSPAIHNNDPYEWHYVTDALTSPRHARGSTFPRLDSTRNSLASDRRRESVASPRQSSPSILANGAPLSAEPTAYEEEDKSDSEDGFSDIHSETGLLSGHPVPGVHTQASWKARAWHNIRHPPQLTGAYKDILKCSFAYLLASLFTFVDPLSDLVGAPFDVEGPVLNAHFVATIATYYNPGKTMGQMLEANLFLVWAALFSLIVCFASMGAAVGLNNDGHEWLSHTVIVCIFLAPSMGFVAWMKNRVGKATFGSACSMTALVNGVLICKEGAVHLGLFDTDAIWQMMFIVLLGAGISNVVCFLVWPGSSTSQLRGDVSKTLDAFAVLTDLLSRAFLLDDHSPLRSNMTLKSAFGTHSASFNSLKSSLEAAKLELFDLRISSSIEVYDDLVSSMNRLAQHLTGLRSGCTLQNRLQQAYRDGSLSDPTKDELPVDENVPMNATQKRLRESARTFRAFERSVGSSLRRLTTECQDTFRELRMSFLKHRKLGSGTIDAELESGKSVAILQRIKHDLANELNDFDRDFTRALKRIYREKPSRTSTTSDDLIPGLDVTPNEDVLELFFFCFTLQELCSELMHLIETVIIIRSREDKQDVAIQLRKQKWGRLAPLFGLVPHFRVNLRRLYELGKRFATLLPLKRPGSPFPPSIDVALSSHWSQRQSLNFTQRISRSLWRTGRKLTRPDIRFALKTGIGAGLLCAPAFIPATRSVWVLYRGEWALISYMVVVATTLGQTNFNTIARIFGTILGALVATVGYHLFARFPVLLALFGWAFSIPCFWLVVTRPKYATTGRFLLLAYNLTALYSYNMREKDLHITLVAFRRSLAVIAGSIWAWVVSSTVWRYEARREMRGGLSELFLNIAWLYEKLVRAYSTPPVELTRPPSMRDVNDASERTSLLTPAARQRLSAMTNEFVEMELHLQRELIELHGLLTQTLREPRLKGPFPVAIYRDVLSSCQVMLDTIHSMRVVTTREAWYTTVRGSFVVKVQSERREMVGNILLYLSLLASTVSLKAPMPPYLPPAGEARLRLMEAIRELPIVKRRAVRKPTDLLYYAYSATVADIITELDFLGETFQNLFGIVGGRGAHEFEQMFEWQEDETLDDAPSTEEDEEEEEASIR